jgi:hypothetical protein
MLKTYIKSKGKLVVGGEAGSSLVIIKVSCHLIQLKYLIQSMSELNSMNHTRPDAHPITERFSQVAEQTGR